MWGGGLSLGASLAHFQDDSIEPLWAIDNNEDACITHRNNLKGEVICADVRKVDFSTLPPIDALAFGFPCNDFSIIGKQRGLRGNYGGLYLECVRALKALKPLWFIAENVGGLQSANGGAALQVCTDAFESCGYRVARKLIDFSELGVPQRRKRFIFFGVLDSSASEIQFPNVNDFRHIDISAKTALTVPPIPADAANNEPSKVSPLVQERLSFIPAGGNVYSKEVPERLQQHAKLKLSNSYRRLDPAKPAYTVVASSGGGNTLFHWKENRPLTNRELARLQSFPDSFAFHGNKASVKKQIGMAVPPLAARILVECILKSLHRA